VLARTGPEAWTAAIYAYLGRQGLPRQEVTYQAINSTSVSSCRAAAHPPMRRSRTPPLPDVCWCRVGPLPQLQPWSRSCPHTHTFPATPSMQGFAGGGVRLLPLASLTRGWEVAQARFLGWSNVTCDSLAAAEPGMLACHEYFGWVVGRAWPLLQWTRRAVALKHGECCAVAVALTPLSVPCRC